MTSARAVAGYALLILAIAGILFNFVRLYLARQNYKILVSQTKGLETIKIESWKLVGKNLVWQELLCLGKSLPMLTVGILSIVGPEYEYFIVRAACASVIIFIMLRAVTNSYVDRAYVDLQRKDDRTGKFTRVSDISERRR